MKCGLLGEKLGHSYSPQIHNQLASYSYTLYEKRPEDLGQFLRSGQFTGLNVTIPYKKAVIPFCDLLTERARQLGAVNTIIRQADGSLLGHNSDYFGFQSMVQRSGLNPTGKKCLVLGSGGASNTVVSVLQEMGAQAVVISRSGKNNYQNLHLHADAYMIVNATPVGMYPNTGVSPIDLSHFPVLEGILDLIYNPAKTQLLLDAEKRGIVAMNGLWMLVAQAKESAEMFSGKAIDDSKIDAVYRMLKAQMENIILIGMPGCGKSTVGKTLARLTGRECADTDDLVVQMSGKSIPEIFAQDGEPRFRQLETQAIAHLGKKSNLIICTGGGCVTQKRNYPLLHQNGTIYWLQRELKLLDTDGRPLSQKANLLQMYQQRKPMYEDFCDKIIDNNGPVAESAALILKNLEE